MLKALSLWQPYAGAIPLGYKTLETRSYPTKHRGKVVIASTVSEPSETLGINLLLKRLIFKKEGNNQDILDRINRYMQHGYALAVADLVDCHQVVISELADFYKRSETGFLGDFSVTRWIWELENIQPLPKPIPWKGGQRLYNATEQQIKELITFNPEIRL